MSQNDQTLDKLKNQYKDSSNLQARIRLHQLFSTNKQGWYPWLFEFYTFPPDARILELGCGPATFWQAVLDDVPATWQITLTDFSAGMVQEAEQNLADSGKQFTFQQMDAQDIQFPDDSFDVVLAHHMLYHVPDRPKALAEIKRVLNPDGVFLAATNGSEHLKGMNNLLIDAFPEYREQISKIERILHVTPFLLDDAADQLTPFFSQVESHRYPDSFHITEAEPLKNYLLSSQQTEQITDEQIAHLMQFLQDRLDKDGAIDIPKHTGVFICRP